MTETLLDELHAHGRLFVTFSTEASLSTTPSLDGSGARLFVGASGRPVALRLEDLVDPEEDRTVHFASISITVRWRDEELLLYGAPGSGVVDPWFTPRPSPLRKLR